MFYIPYKAKEKLDFLQWVNDIRKKNYVPFLVGFEGIIFKIKHLIKNLPPPSQKPIKKSIKNLLLIVNILYWYPKKIKINNNSNYNTNIQT